MLSKIRFFEYFTTYSLIIHTKWTRTYNKNYTSIEQSSSFFYFKEKNIICEFLVAQWFLCIDYSLQQEREKPGFTFDDNNEKEETTIEHLKQLKIIPLHNQTQLVSIEQFKNWAILFPLDKSTPYANSNVLIFVDRG